MALFKKGPPPHQTALAMVGARAGDRVFFAGRPDPALVAEVGRTTGLNGQTLLAVSAGDRKPFDAAAADAGVLLEHVELPNGATRLPAADGSHDAVVLHVDLHGLSEGTRRDLVDSALAAVRPGGRVIIIEGRRRGGLFASRTATLPEEAVLALLEGVGAVAGRAVGREDVVTYFEARKRR